MLSGSLLFSLNETHSYNSSSEFCLCKGLELKALEDEALNASRGQKCCIRAVLRYSG